MKFYNPTIKPKNCKEVREFADKKGIAKKFVMRYRTGYILVEDGKIIDRFTGTLKEVKLNFNK